MFTDQQIDELIRLGWAPEYDDRMRIVGFDKWANEGENAIVPRCCSLLVRYVGWRCDPDGRLSVTTNYQVRPQQAVSVA